ncbi:MAG: SRPBCC family protein [Methylococcus sp.]|jgi:hypothetical protein
MMDLKLKVNRSDPVLAESTAIVAMEQEKVFDFIANQFHRNYQKWMPDVVELEALDGLPVTVGSKFRQVRLENDDRITSLFEITEREPCHQFSFKGLDQPYRQTYCMNAVAASTTHVTFRFELLEVDIFMRPFVKLIRAAMVEGVESTVETLHELLSQKVNQ